MSCYLCAYKRTNQPRSRQTLPSGGPVGPNEDIGNCSKCSVLACSSHGTRYGKFECAICTPATAAAAAMGGGATSGSAASFAHAVGVGRNDSLRDQARIALERIVADSRVAVPADNLSLVAPSSRSPNLITNLADVIRQQHPAIAPREIKAVQEDRGEFGSLSLDAIGGAVRERFVGTDLAEPSDDAITTVVGALLLGYSLADQIDDQAISGPETIHNFPPPWQVIYPILLDPVLWLIGTALQPPVPGEN